MNLTQTALFDLMTERCAQIITVNQRLAFNLQQAFHAYQQTLQQIAAQGPSQILPLADWYEQQHQAVTAQDLTLLTEAQASFLWRQCVRASQYADHLLSPDSIVPSAQQAWQLLHEYECTQNDLKIAATEDIQAFMVWAEAFRQACQQQKLITQATLPQQLAEHGWQPKQSVFILVGFIDIPPQLSQLLSGVEVISVELQHRDSSQSTLVQSCADTRTERLAAIQWAKQQYLNDPKQQIMIVVPNLHQERDVWDSTLHSELQDVDCAYNVSGGVPLSHVPVIRDALLTIQAKYARDFSVVEDWALSPFIHAAELEADVRFTQQLQWRHEASSSWGLHDLLKLPDWQLHCPELVATMQALRDINWPSRATRSQWLQVFQDTWQVVGWAAAEVISDTHQQAINQFEQVLQQWQAIDAVDSRPITWQQALQGLQHLATQSVFQAKGAPSSAIQVVGQLESVGLCADHMWVCQLNQQVFPAAPRPQALLPISLQRNKAMPHASHEREYYFAKRQLQQWQQQSRHLVLSYATLDNGQIQCPSPLLPLDAARSILTEVNSRARMRLGQCAVPVAQQEPLPPVSEVEHADIRGGAAVLQAQSHCGFKAAARHRWQVEGMAEIPRYFTPAMRGNMLHELLQHIWQQIQTHAQLSELLETNQLQSVVDQHVAKIMRRWQQRYADWLPQHISDLEQQRLQQLLIDWLRLEQTRPPFTVLAKEQRIIGEVAGLTLHMRIDRIDELPDGSRVLLDYKTGPVSHRSWEGERPMDPQLPLYAVLAPANGAAFASVRQHEMRWSGITETFCLPGVAALSEGDDAASSWSALISEWRDVLTQLAQGFLMGNADVDPVNASACQYCDLHRLCRVGAIDE